MELTIYQIILLTIYSFIAINDSLITNTLTQPVVSGFVAGLIMGDMKVGLTVGATLQLMRLGIAAFGGASIPDYFSGALLGTVFAVLSGQGAKFGVGLAVPVSLLMLQLDVVARFCNVFLLHRIDKAIDNLEDQKISPLVLSGSMLWGLSRAIPVLIMLLAGSATIQSITTSMPDWLMGGLKTAGGVLPVVGIGVLLRYLPVKKFVPFLILGFVLSSYLKLPILGVFLLGLVIAMLFYKMNSTKKEETTTKEHVLLEGGYDGDE